MPKKPITSQGFSTFHLATTVLGSSRSSESNDANDAVVVAQDDEVVIVLGLEVGLVLSPEVIDVLGLEGVAVLGFEVIDVLGLKVVRSTVGAAVGSSTTGPRKRTAANLLIFASGVGSPAECRNTCMLVYHMLISYVEGSLGQ